MSYMKIDVQLIFQNNIKFVEYSRSGVVYYTESLDELYELKKLGWKFNACNAGYRIIPPSVTVCDITECKKIEQYKNIILNLAYFTFLKKLKEKHKLEDYICRVLKNNEVYYKNFSFHVSYSPILEAEIKIEGVDQRLYRLKEDMLVEFMNQDDYEYAYLLSKKQISINKMYIKEKENNPKILSFYETLMQKNSIVKPVNIPFEHYQIDTSVLETLEYDIMLFIPYGCYKFINLFINKNNYQKVMFWEVHIDQSKPNIHKLYAKEIRGRRILILDSVYSGKTLLYIKKMIEKMGGIPIVLGIYPKSKSVINILDYVLLINKVYKTDELDLDDSKFFEHIYTNSCKGMMKDDKKDSKTSKVSN